MTTARELWSAARTLMDRWDSLDGESQPTDLETIVEGFNFLRIALETFNPEGWADEAKMQAAIGLYALRTKQETDRADRAEALLAEAQKP